MTPVPFPEIRSGLVDDLLALPTLDQRSEYLRTASLLSADGLDRLLDMAERLVHADPGRAHRLAALCADAADRAAAPAAVPRASYVRTQTYHANGEFDAGLRMADEAYEGYVALGMNLQALRTHVGRMWPFIELGLYRETLDAKLEFPARQQRSDAAVDAAQADQSLGVAVARVEKARFPHGA